MERNEILAALRAHEAQLKAVGVDALSLVGSAARGEDRADSDIDVVVRLSDEARKGGFAYFGRLAAIKRQLETILGKQVDVLAEPISRDHLREKIERDRILAF